MTQEARKTKKKLESNSERKSCKWIGKTLKKQLVIDRCGGVALPDV